MARRWQEGDGYQHLVLNGVTSTWKEASNGEPKILSYCRTSILQIFMNDLDEGVELINADDTKLRGIAKKNT